MLASEVQPDVQTRRVEVSGLNVEVWTGGSGPPLLFLHPGDGFDPAAPFVADLARRFTVIAPSHPGFGATDLPNHIGTVDDLSYFYLDFLRCMDLRQVILAGVSFGGWIAAEIAVKGSARLSGLVLADTVGAKFGAKTTREIADLFTITPFDIPRLVHRDPEAHRRNYAPLPEPEVLRHARNYESFGLFAWAPTLHNPKLRHRLHLIEVPTLVLWGAEDRVVAPDYGRRWAAAIPGARFEMIEGAGHYLHMDAPAPFAAAIGAFADAIAAPL